jgi:hypothetical protein
MKDIEKTKLSTLFYPNHLNIYSKTNQQHKIFYNYEKSMHWPSSQTYVNQCLCHHSKKKIATHLQN